MWVHTQIKRKRKRRRKEDRKVEIERQGRGSATWHQPPFVLGTPSPVSAARGCREGGWGRDCHECRRVCTWVDTGYLEAEEGKKHAFTWTSWLHEGSLKRVPRTETLEFLGARVNFSTKLQQANEKRRQRCPSSLPPPKRRHGRLATHGS